MDNIHEFLSARDRLVSDIKRELLGEDEGGDFVIDNPVKRYSTGMIFPLGYEDRNKETVAETEAEKDDESQAQVTESDQPSEMEEASALANAFFPSVMGLSFYAKGEEPMLKVTVSYSKYEKMPWEEVCAPIEKLPVQLETLQEFNDNFYFKKGKIYGKKKLEGENIDTVISRAIEDKDVSGRVYTVLHQIRLGHKDGFWKRIKRKEEIQIGKNIKTITVAEGLELIINRREKDGNTILFTVCVKNTNEGGDDDQVFFQVSIRVEGLGRDRIFTEYNFISEKLVDEEERALAFLYRNKKSYAAGHGCSAGWDFQGGDEKEGPVAVYTEAIPTYELPAADFTIPELSEENAEKILSMKLLAGLAGDDRSIISGLKEFAGIYHRWVDSLGKRKDIPKQFEKEAARNISLCEEVDKRMNEGISLLANDSVALKAFKLANLSMLSQSLQSELQKKRINVKDEAFQWPDPAKVNVGEKQWRPFQLAFLLLSLVGISDASSDDRNLVDLIWFPTGGGKTEAYLGLTAYTIFFRRLKYGDQGGGTTVMMRYTLRLLTAQQFQRACTLICAMEKIRAEDSEKSLGSEEVSVGLWVGYNSTPNTFDDAERKLAEYRRTGKRLPSPLLACPWCGTSMVTRGMNSNDYAMKHKKRPERMQLYCKERKCFFNERLPIKIVDEEIYEAPPTLLFGTVDKFAQMPYQKGIASIFGIGGKNLTPELIIQDELHLISGALGTMVALYETAVDYLCSKKGRAPKVIASTATIRRAQEQCLGLFARNARQFPAPGLEIEDSFFTKEAPRSKPGRLYVGIMGSGKTQTTVAVRLAAALLTGVSDLEAPDSVKDNYWTLVGYFNSIRELGGFISLIHDDVGMYVNTLRERYGGTLRAIGILKELTSREDAEEIPKTLGELSIPYPENGRVDVVAATNMISVGVDIDRLGLMVVRGQPKLTSEYIQVTSRVGRKFPGLVAVLYNSARTRDRAHYERFLTYHSTFYRNVEPSSITPFSIPARLRALHAVIVSMVRHTLPDMGGEKDAVLFKKSAPGIGEIKEFILKRVRKIDPGEEEGTKQELEKTFYDWEIFGSTQHENGVYSNDKNGKPLLARSGNDTRGLWEAPTSMRNVDQECAIYFLDE